VVSRRLLTGVRSVALGKACAYALGAAGAVVLARLIAPAGFGHAVVALVVQALASALVHQGFGAPLVQRERIDRSDLEAAGAMAMVAGVGAAAACAALSLTVLPAAFGAESARLVALASAAFPIYATAVVGSALLQRDLAFRSTSRAEVLAIVAAVPVSVGLALAGLEGTALVVGALTGSLASALYVLAVARPPLPRWRRGRMRALAGFGAPSALSSLIQAGGKNVDYVLLGALLAPAQVAYYWRAFTLGAQIHQKASSVMTHMAFAAFSRSSGPLHMRRMRLRMTRVHSTLIVPALALLIALAPELVPFVFGDRWEPAVVPTQILAVAGIASTLVTGNGAVVLASGRPWILVWWNSAKLVLVAVAVVITAPHGIVAVSAAVVVAKLVTVAGSYGLILHRLLRVPVAEIVKEAAPGPVASLPLLAVSVPLANGASALGLPAPAVCAVTALAGGTVYLAVLAALFRDALDDVRLLVRSVFGRDRPQHPVDEPAALASVARPARPAVTGGRR
jgi:lipopolysaccharide exporter